MDSGEGNQGELRRIFAFWDDTGLQKISRMECLNKKGRSWDFRGRQRRSISTLPEALRVLRRN